MPNSSKVFFGCRLLLYAILAILVISISGDVEYNPGPASITNSYQASGFLQSRDLKVAHLNIRSIYNKIDSLKLLLNEKPFDIFTISETWLNSDITDGEISIPAYTFSRNDRNGRSGGGTLAFVRDGIPYKIRTDLLSSNANIESTVIAITRPKCKSLFIFTIYKAPDQLLESLTEELDTALSSISLEAEVILLGDFNVNFLATKNDAFRALKRKLLSLTSMYNLEQLIDKPTRITENSSTLIDLLFANNNHRIVSSGVLHVNLSDHSLIYCVVKAGVRRAPGRVIEYRSYKTYSKQSFLADPVHVNFDLIDEEQNINVAVSKWDELFTNVADFHAPIKKLRTIGIQTPWLTTDLSNAMQDRDYHHRKAVKSNSPFHWMMYKKIKSYVNTNVKKCKAEYYSILINTNKGNTGALWKTLNDISSRQSHSSPSCIEANGISHTDPKSIAESLNDHFSSIGSKWASKIRNLYPNRNSIKQPSQFRENVFVLQPIEESYVYGVLNNLKTNKAVGLDKISARLLKDSSSVITPILTKLFNRSLISSTFP